MFVFFNDTATTEIYTLSLHDALPIYFLVVQRALAAEDLAASQRTPLIAAFPKILYGILAIFPGLIALSVFPELDRKSTRLNSSHANISYAVFCLKKKTTISYNTKYKT